MKLPRLRTIVLTAMVVSTVATVGWWQWGPRGIAVELTRRSWRMEVVIERLRAETDSAWCDELPTLAPDAIDISRRLAADPSGKREGLSERCNYTVLAWRRQWIAKTEGGPESRLEEPRPPLRWAPPGQPGSERYGKREAFYEIELRELHELPWLVPGPLPDGHVWTCRVSRERWQALRPGLRLRIPANRFGAADCAAMYPSRL